MCKHVSLILQFGLSTIDKYQLKCSYKHNQQQQQTHHMKPLMVELWHKPKLTAPGSLENNTGM
jgi:hypothetical protein